MESIRHALLNDTPAIISGEVLFAASEGVIRAALAETDDGFQLLGIEAGARYLAPSDLFTALEIDVVERHIEAAINANERSVQIVRSMLLNGPVAHGL